MDSMSCCDICLVFTFPTKDSTLQYKKCVHLWNNFPCKLVPCILPSLKFWRKNNISKELSFCHNHWFSKPYIFWDKYQRPSGCQDIGFRKSKFVTKTQFLWEGEGYKTILKQILCKLCKAIEFQRTPWEILQEGIWSAKIEAEEGGGGGWTFTVKSVLQFLGEI